MTLRSAALLLLTCLSSAVRADLGFHDLTVENEAGQDRRYSLLVYRPDGERPHSDAELILEQLARFLGFVYHQGRLFDERAGPTLAAGIRRVDRGEISLVAVTYFGDPMRVFQAIAVADEGPRGTPTEERLAGRGVTRLARLALEPRIVPMEHYNTEGPLERNAEISHFLSRRPWLVGGPGSHAELTKLAKAPDCPRDFSGVLHNALVAFGHTRRGARLPTDRRLPPLEGALAVEARRLEAAYPTLPAELWHPELQRHTVLTHLHAHAVEHLRVALYRRFFAFPEPEQEFHDEDFHADASLFSITRERWEQVTAARLDERVTGTRRPRLAPAPGLPLDMYRTVDIRRAGRYRRSINLRETCEDAVLVQGRSLPIRYWPLGPR